MKQPDIPQMLKERFDKPLDECASRRIVIWHDGEGSFGGLFDQIAAQGLDTQRPVTFAKVEEGGMFALKRRLYRQEPDSDFLVYTPHAKDLSAKGLEGNWLADIEFQADHFQADYASMLADELGAVDSAAEALGDFGAFFKAADRRTRFKRLMPHAQSRADVALGVVGAVLHAPDLSTEALVRTYLCELDAGDDPLAELQRYGADETFARFAAKRIGYAGDLSVAGDMAAHLMLTALYAQVPQGTLASLESRISPVHAQFCLNIVHAWMASEADADVLYRLARQVEQACNLPERFIAMSTRDLRDADVFPCINECLAQVLFNSMADGADRADEAEAVLQRRKDLRWFSRMSERFDALEAAIAAQRFYREHAQVGFHCARSADAWKAYTGDWFRMDTAYRAFFTALDACRRSGSDVPVSMDDALDRLAGWMERIYVNWFLAESNACWVACSETAWEQVGYAEGIPRQERFFNDQVRGGNAKKTLVVVSDALRFEVAAELAQRLERDTSGMAHVSAMQGVFPTITKFGMAALLPHRSMAFSEAENEVLLDGDVPVADCKQRQAALRRAEPTAVCIHANDLLDAKRVDRKGKVGDASIVYVYHNQIDATGEGATTESKVFEACSGAIDDIVALVRIAVNDLQFSRVLITADHGFLYTRNPLQERDKVAGAEAEGDKALVGRRYAVCSGAGPDATVFVKMNMSDVGGGEYTGLAPRECVRIKQPGPGENFVHGGVSLQEACVPVVEFRNKRSGQKGYEGRERAGFKLLSTNRLVSSAFFSVKLLQEKPVGGKVLPAGYEFVMTDDSGNDVSDVCRAMADMAAQDSSERVSHVRFTLKPGISYDAHKAYYLVCRSADSGAIEWKEEFQIDLPFAPDDFGF